MSSFAQRTSEWLEMRKNYIGASDAPVVMGVSPWKTPYQLWQQKLSLVPEQEQTPAMQRGVALEEKARLKFEEMTGLYTIPEVLLHPNIQYMMASLDGIDIGRENIVEIKCPNKDDHAMAVGGQVPEKYYPQLQHQMEVCQLEKAHYFSFNGEEGVVLVVYRDDKYIRKMLEREAEFWECVEEVIAPKLTQKDYEKKSDLGWAHVALDWLQLSKEKESLEKREKEIRSRLVEMAGNKNCIGCGIKMSKIVRKGNVDYSLIPELKDLNLEAYRKAPIELWKISQE